MPDDVTMSFFFWVPLADVEAVDPGEVEPVKVVIGGQTTWSSFKNVVYPVVPEVPFPDEETTRPTRLTVISRTDTTVDVVFEPFTEEEWERKEGGSTVKDVFPSTTTAAGDESEPPEGKVEEGKTKTGTVPGADVESCIGALTLKLRFARFLAKDLVFVKTEKRGHVVSNSE